MEPVKDVTTTDANIYDDTKVIREAFRQYKQMGMDPLPIPARKGDPVKFPLEPGWPKKAANGEYTEEHFAECSNIGILHGGPRNITDLDLDSPMAVKIGNAILDKENAVTFIFGHASKRRSHYIYETDKSLRTETIKDPLAKAGEKDTVIEYRCATKDGRGVQTVVPPSLWRDEKNGEVQSIECEDDSTEAPIFVESATLHRQFRLIGSIALLAKYFPVKSGRHDTMLALGGVFARNNVPQEEAIRIVRLAYRHSGGYIDDEYQAESAVKAAYAGEHPYGYPTLIELIDPKVVNRVLELLNIPVPGTEGKPALKVDPATIIQMLDDEHLSILPVAPITYFVEPEIQRGVITSVTGPAGSGKSTLVTNWCLQVAEENPNVQVLYLDADNPQSAINERLARLSGALPKNFRFWGNWNQMQPYAIGSPELDAVIQRLIENHGECIVVVDTLRAFYDGEENDNSDMAAFFKPLKRWTGWGVTPIVLHHTDKENKHKYCGASSLIAAIDCGLLVTSSMKDGRIVTMEVESFKNRSGNNVDVKYKMWNGAPVRDTDTFDRKLLALLADNPCKSKDEFERFAMKHGFTREKVREFLDEAQFRKLIEVKRGSVRVVDASHHAATDHAKPEPDSEPVPSNERTCPQREM